MHKFWELHEMFLTPTSRFLIQDVYGKWILRRPGYATLDGLPVDEWNAKPKEPQE
jgi:hypothetical protein